MSLLYLRPYIMVVGMVNSGKTNLIGSFIGQDFNTESSNNSLEYLYFEYSDDIAKFDFTFTHNTYFSDYSLYTTDNPYNKAILICYDVSNPESLKAAKGYFEYLKDLALPKYLVANKCDLEKKCLEEGKSVAESYGATHWECSAKDRVNTAELFQALQTLIQTTDKSYFNRKNLKSWREDIQNINSDDNSISALIYGESESAARELANKLFREKLGGRDVWSESINGRDIYAYVRWPLCKPNDFPKSPVYALFLNFNLEEDRSNKEEQISIFDNSSVAINSNNKILFSPYNTHHWGFVSKDLNSIDDQMRNEILTNIANHDDELRKLFDTIDTNKSGTIDAEELRKLLNLENPNTDVKEAEKYLAEISDKEVTYNRYRAWYLARYDYYSSPVAEAARDRLRVIKESLFAKKILAAASESVLQLTDEEKKQTFNYKINVAPEGEYSHGIFADFSITTGKNAIEVINKLPENLVNQPISFVLGIGTKSQESSSLLLTTLQLLKVLISAGVPQFQEFNKNFDVRFRTAENKLFIDLTLKGRASEGISPLFAYDLSSYNINGEFELGLGTAFKPYDVFTDNFESLAQKVCSINLISRGSVLLAVLSRFVSKLYQSLPDASDIKPLVAFAVFLNFLRLIPNIESTVALHPQKVIDFLKEVGLIVEEFNFEQLKGLIDNTILPEIRETFQGIKQSFGSKVGEFKNAILGLNLEDLTFNIYSRALSLNVEFDLKIVGADLIFNKFFEA